ncbi:MAG: metallophosphoesterase [Candidatus Xenobia bacterium]
MLYRLLLLLVLGAQLTASRPLVTFQPYVQLGNHPGLDGRDQIVVLWQTAETAPHPEQYTVNGVRPQGHLIDDWFGDLPAPPTWRGPRVMYEATLKGLPWDRDVRYTVKGPGFPPQGFSAVVHTRRPHRPVTFTVVGDQGFFPEDPATHQQVDYQSRIVHEMYEAHPDFVLETGDNVYNRGSDGGYADFWMPVWNSDVADGEHGAPLIRSVPVYVALGNHDMGGEGTRVNLYADDTAGPFSGKLDGGDALAYFNVFRFPLDGPTGFGVQDDWTGEKHTQDGFFLHYQGKDIQNAAAIGRFRASTNGRVDKMANYSFDDGEAHVMVLDANPHLWGNQAEYTPLDQKPCEAFPPCPSGLLRWVIADLDASNQPWKIVVFHQPPFSSGQATARNFQMRGLVRTLEDHGVNVVFLGHSHNYQRTRPVRATARVAEAPVPGGPPLVNLDMHYDGVHETVPDGILYINEGAGGDRDFDNDLEPPRGLGPSPDEDDSATGTLTLKDGRVVPNGPGLWLDTHLTSALMPLPGAGQGPKITVIFKSRVFSFAKVKLSRDRMDVTQISEPLSDHGDNFGTDVNGKPLHAPLPDNHVDAHGHPVGPPQHGTPAVLDRFSITRADLSTSLRRQGNHLVNDSRYALNGVQIVREGGEVRTIGRVPRGGAIPVPSGTFTVRSSTGLPVYFP